jgi:ATP-dependent helicase/nuclease subunit A
MGLDGTLSREEMESLDQETRLLAQTEFRTPLVVEAGAGTGKTTALTARIVAWSIGPGWERAEGALQCRETDRIAARVFDRIVAITFTEAAASEMSSRVGQALSEMEKGRVPCGLLADALSRSPEANRARARALLGCLDRLTVMTIHAFCRRLLVQYPIEAGLHPNFVVDAEGVALEQLVREVVEDAVRVGYSEPGDPHLLALAAKGHGPQRIAEALTRLASEAVSPEILEEDPFSAKRVRSECEAAAGELEVLLEREGRCLERVTRSPLTARVIASLEATLQELRRVAASDSPYMELQRLCAWVRERWTKALLERLEKWGREEFVKAESDVLGPWKKELPGRAASLHARLRHLAWMEPETLLHARAALCPLLKRVDAEIRSRGIQTFTGLLKGAQRLLTMHPEIRASVRRSMDQLLVDEFQDTDSIQCEIIRTIALDGPADERPGLFIVGDPKQSIYGWRSADLEAYEGFVSDVLRSGGERRLLVVNFRSAPAILEEVERIVGPVMRERPGLQPAFEPLLPCPARRKGSGFSKGARAPVEYWVSWTPDQPGRPAMDKTPAKEAAEMEAEALAREILSLHWEHGVAWQEIGVLLRTTGDLDTYLSAFRDFEIPYAVERDRNYYRRREIIEASALFRSVVDPHDHLALVTFLRSAMVGVPDAAWIPLWRHSFPEMVTELRGADSQAMARLRAAVEEAARCIPADIPGIERIAGWEEALLSALEDLAVLRESFDTEPIDLFVARMRSLLLQEATESARYLGPYRLANLDRFFRQLTEALESGEDPQAVIRALRVGVMQLRDAEEGRPKGESGEAVQVMTIHKAKGLDFGHLFVMQLHRGSRQEEGEEDAVVWHAGQWEWKLLGVPTLGFARVLEKRRRVAHAELVRTLYVAATRAKDRLVLAGRWQTKSKVKSIDNATTHMDLLQWRRPEVPPLEALMRERVGGGGPLWADAAGARWVFLGLVGSEPPVHVPAAEALELPGAEQVRSEAVAVARRVAAARALMDRPLSAPASMESHDALKEILVAAAPPFPGRGEGVALAVGRAIHRALESLDLSAEPDLALKAQRVLLPFYLGPFVSGNAMAEALERAGSLWDRFSRGQLSRRLLGLRDHLVARELPVLLPPLEGQGPVGFVAGSVDLLYRDPHSGRMVVADYKTDIVEGEEALMQRARLYASQISVYVRAVREALGLDEEPRAELWFLYTGEVLAVGGEPIAG